MKMNFIAAVDGIQYPEGTAIVIVMVGLGALLWFANQVAEFIERFRTPVSERRNEDNRRIEKESIARKADSDRQISENRDSAEKRMDELEQEFLTLEERLLSKEMFNAAQEARRQELTEINEKLKVISTQLAQQNTDHFRARARIHQRLNSHDNALHVIAARTDERGDHRGAVLITESLKPPAEATGEE